MQVEGNETIGMQLDKAFKGTAKFAIAGLAVSALCASISTYIIASVSLTGEDKPTILYAIAYFVAALCFGFMPIIITFLVSRALYGHLLGIKSIHEAQARRDREIEALAESLKPAFLGVNEGINRLASVSGKDFPVRKFYDSFQSVDWENLLMGAKRVDVSAFYWNSSWASENIPRFRSAIKKGCSVRFYLPNPKNYTSEFCVQSAIKDDVSARIVESIADISSYSIDNMTNNIDIRLCGTAVNYMMARIARDNGRVYLYSPFRSASDKAREAGRPPVLALDDARMSPGLRTFFDGEFNALERASEAFPLLGAGRLITWSADNSRVIVSADIKCELPCKFCYVESLRASSAVGFGDKSLLGEVVVESIRRDPRFIEKKGGTKILLGGMSEPFLGNNSAFTESFLSGVNKKKIRNTIHIASRIPIKDGDEDRMIELMKKNVLLNFSLSCLREDVEMPKRAILQRIEKAGIYARRGVRVAIYLRPVLPKATLEDLEEIMNAMDANGLKKITVGDLYIDDKITSKLGAVTATAKAGRATKAVDGGKRMVLDRDGVLRKINNDEVETIVGRLRDRQFDVYRSSVEISQKEI